MVTRPWVWRPARSSRLQKQMGPRSHPRRVTMKVTTTSWLRVMRIRADHNTAIPHDMVTATHFCVAHNCLYAAQKKCDSFVK